MKNKILKGITKIAATGFVLSGMGLDSPSNTPLVVGCVCLAWLGLFTYVNRDRYWVE